MSDTSQGEGWWQASDGKWYAPEQHPDFQPPTQPVEASSPPTEAAQPPEPGQPPTEAMPPTEAGPPTQAMPPPYGPPGSAPGVPPPGGPGTPPGAPGKSSNNKKWIIPAAIAAVIVAIAAFLLFRGGDDNKSTVAATDASSQSTDKTDSSSSSTKSSSKSTSSSSTSKETVNPNGVKNTLLTAEDIGSEFTDQTFTPSSETTDLCGNPNARAQVPPTLDVGSVAVEASSNKRFEEAVVFHKSAADNKKAFDIGINSAKTCNQGTQTDASGSVSSFTISEPTDVSDEVGVTEAVEFTIQSGDQTVILVGVRLDNCIASFIFQFPTSAGESGKPDATGIAKDGVDKLLS